MDHVLTSDMVALVANTPRNTRGYRMYTIDVRTSLTQTAIQLKNEGFGLRLVAERMGISLGILVRWIHDFKKEQPSVLIPVRINLERSPTLTLHGPCGTRIDGLEIQDVVAIFRSMAC